MGRQERRIRVTGVQRKRKPDYRKIGSAALQAVLAAQAEADAQAQHQRRRKARKDAS